MTQMTMKISGMTCGHCVGAVKSALAQLDGVQIENVAIGSAVLLYDPNVIAPDSISHAVEEAGYEAIVAS